MTQIDFIDNGIIPTEENRIFVIKNIKCFESHYNVLN